MFAADVAELADAQVSGTCGLRPWRFDSSHPHCILDTDFEHFTEVNTTNVCVNMRNQR